MPTDWPTVMAELEAERRDMESRDDIWARAYRLARLGWPAGND